LVSNRSRLTNQSAPIQTEKTHRTGHYGSSQPLGQIISRAIRVTCHPYTEFKGVSRGFFSCLVRGRYLKTHSKGGGDYCEWRLDGARSMTYLQENAHADARTRFVVAERPNSIQPHPTRSVYRRFNDGRDVVVNTWYGCTISLHFAFVVARCGRCARRGITRGDQIVPSDSESMRVIARILSTE
jgi:hypothetical protein